MSRTTFNRQKNWHFVRKNTFRFFINPHFWHFLVFHILTCLFNSCTSPKRKGLKIVKNVHTVCLLLLLWKGPQLSSTATEFFNTRFPVQKPGLPKVQNRGNLKKPIQQTKPHHMNRKVGLFIMISTFLIAPTVENFFIPNTSRFNTYKQFSHRQSEENRKSSSPLEKPMTPQL